MAGDSKTVNFTFTSPLTVSNLRVVNATDGSLVESLEEGDVLDLATLPEVFTILSDPRYSYNSVEYTLSGAISRKQLQNMAPYALYSKQAGQLNPASLVPGEYSLQVVPFLGSHKAGYAGEALTVNFTVVDSNASARRVAYPVPFNSELNLRMKAVDLSTTLIQLVHAYGQVYEVQASQIIQTEEGWQLNIAHLPAGPYTVRIQGHDKIQSLRVVKE